MGNKYEGLAGLGRVGTKAYEAYISLREGTEDGEFKLLLNITLRLLDGGVVTLGPGLLLTTNQQALQGLEGTRGLLTGRVSRRRRRSRLQFNFFGGNI